MTPLWNYDGYRGFLAGKTYAGPTAGPAYTYTAAGRLATRAWVRGVTTTYGYDNAGGLASVTYSDGTAGVTNAYDNLGHLTSVVVNGMMDTLSYNLAGNLLTESFSGGPLNGLSVSNQFDNFLRRTNLSILGATTPSQTAYGYDAASRLATVNDGNNDVAAYSYLANSPLVGQIVFTQNGSTRMTTTKQYDNLNRLTQISSAPTAAYMLRTFLAS